MHSTNHRDGLYVDLRTPTIKITVQLIYNSIATLLTSHKQLHMLTILSILYGILSNSA